MSEQFLYPVEHPGPLIALQSSSKQRPMRAGKEVLASLDTGVHIRQGQQIYMAPPSLPKSTTAVLQGEEGMRHSSWTWDG